VENWFEHDDKSYDGMGEYFNGKSLKELWNVVPKLPLNPSYLLIKFLPTKGGLSSNIPEEIVQQMSVFQLRFLLEREDIYLPELRREIFFSKDMEKWLKGDTRLTSENMGKWLKETAVSHNFDLTYEEFGQILAKPKDQQKDELDMFMIYAADLSLCFYAAMVDLKSSDDLSDIDSRRWITESLKKRLSRLKGSLREEQIREERLYHLAWRAVHNYKNNNFEGGPGDEVELLNYFKEKIVQGDAWGTFIKFSEAWKNQEPRQLKDREKILARLFGNETEEAKEAKMDKADEPLVSGIENAEYQPSQSSPAITSQNQTELVAPLTAELSRIKRLVEIVLYLLIFLAGVLFFRK
ncbi:MAG: hypothetical protein WAK60_01390, partial [Sedimentisphaerales bacterium]